MVAMDVKSLHILILKTIIHLTLQEYREDISYKGISVESDPQFYRNKSLVTRNCAQAQGIPSLKNIDPCLNVNANADLPLCFPGFRKILGSNNDYCFNIETASAWNLPCLHSGGGSIITDLTLKETDSLLQSLNKLNISRYYWLPAQRRKPYNPAVWFIPGPNWGRRVRPRKWLRLETVFSNSCVLLDIKQQAMITESCSNVYPTLCLYINDFNYPAKCPNGYHAFRFRPENASCFGVEQSEISDGNTYDNFLISKCKKPMTTDSEYTGLSSLIFKEIAKLQKVPDETWCWVKISPSDYYMNITNCSTNCKDDSNLLISKTQFEHLEGSINNIGTLGLLNKSRSLACMACETDLIYEETELMFEYNYIDNKIYLTVYYPSGLWKYNSIDKGIQCFSNAEGFVTVIDVNENPLPATIYLANNHTNYKTVEKVVYVIDLVTETSAQYWCQGHTKNFSLITTDKILVNPNGGEFQVFSLITRYNFYNEIEDPDISHLIPYLTVIFNAKAVLLMDILEYCVESMLIVLHVHVVINSVSENEPVNLIQTYDTLKHTAQLELPRYNFTLVNISSSLYCLPVTSKGLINLQWEMIPIGHTTAPKQFCLQSNGLPVNRRCEGSYLIGSTWSEVEGHCDTTYKPTKTTTFLYRFVKGDVPNNYTSSFLTNGLSFVLHDTDILIPADIYYLSMSLQQILHVVKENETFVDLSNLKNIAWAMDRVMVLDSEYLRLAQTLNSTNVILNSVSNIIELITQKSFDESTSVNEDERYQLTVKQKYVVQISFPHFNNITGIAVCRKKLSDEFTDMIIKPLYRNTSIQDVLSLQNLEVATWVPTEVLNTLKLNSNESDSNAENIHVIISVFSNDAVFQEVAVQNHTVNSRIVSLTIPGYLSKLEYSVPLIFRALNYSKYETTCVYWDFQSETTNYVPGIWRKQGCYLVKTVNNLTVCECYHLTHFGQLVNVQGSMNLEEYTNNKYHTKALNIITLSGCFLSLFGVVGIWVTALIFSNWRKKASTKILLQLSTAIALPLVLILTFNLNATIVVNENGLYSVSTEMRHVCIILGALLHYSILASFMWMLITAILQFIRYVQVLGVKRPKRFMCKFNLIGWGIPIIPVIIMLLVDANNYVPGASYNKRICYPTGTFLILGVLIPICLILTVNIILFILVLHAISRGSDETVNPTADMDLICTQLRLSIFLFFLLGLTWIFGILSFSNNILWSYLFCLTSTLQGFVLFVYFIICDPSTRRLWITLIKPQVHRGSTRSSIISLNAT